MAITFFHSFTIAFDGSPPGAPDAELKVPSSNRYLLKEDAAREWKVFENGQPVALTRDQHDELRRLIEALRPLPDESAPAPGHGEDGTWYTVQVRQPEGTRGYRWWVEPPPEWARLAEVVRCAQSLAEAPRRILAQRNREVAEQFFGRLGARDVAGAMACCDAQIEYSSPFFELRGARVASMWRMWLGALPALSLLCDDIRAGYQGASAHWSAEYTLGTGASERRVRHRVSADLSFAEGKIIGHRDRFNLHEWASLRYGSVGGALGGRARFQKWVVARERARLAAFERADAG